MGKRDSLARMFMDLAQRDKKAKINFLVSKFIQILRTNVVRKKDQLIKQKQEQFIKDIMKKQNFNTQFKNVKLPDSKTANLESQMRSNIGAKLSD
jgi:hypothetical protein